MLFIAYMSYICKISYAQLKHSDWLYTVLAKYTHNNTNTHRNTHLVRK